MKPAILILTVFCFVYFSTSAQTAISLSGTVVNGAGDPISGATVYLNSDSTLGDTTDESGQFALLLGTPVTSGYTQGTSRNTLQNIGVNYSQLYFHSSNSIKHGVSSIFTSKGECISKVSLQSSKAGFQTYPLPELSAGTYILKITVDGNSISRKLICTGKDIYMNNSGSGIQSQTAAQTAAITSTETTDTLLIESDGFKPLKEPITSYQQSDLSIIMDYTKSPPIDVDELPTIEEMPDPFTMNDGTEVTTLEQWRKRRREMIRILEDYEYGHMPPPPENVTSSVVSGPDNVSGGTYRRIHLTFGPDEQCGFDVGLFIPANDDVEQHPVLIYVGYGSPGQSSISQASSAFSRGYAVAMINYSDLGADSPNWKSSAFFPHYPDYDWRDFSAWAWGISRVVDYLVTDSLIDSEKIMATGASRCGQPVLLAGALDERIALSAPVAGGMALRFSGAEMAPELSSSLRGQGITEVVDQGTYWFGPLLEEFRNKTPKLPCDQHWLPALTAPRLFILLNSLSDEYGRAYAAAQTYLEAKPVYEFLGAPENIGQNFRAGGHGFYPADWEALLDFADQYLLGKEGDRRFDVLPSEDQMP